MIAYVAATDGAHIIDVADASATRLLGFWKQDRGFTSVQLEDSIVYLATKSEPGSIIALDIRNPKKPIQVGSYSQEALAGLVITTNFRGYGTRPFRVCDLSNGKTIKELYRFDGAAPVAGIPGTALDRSAQIVASGNVAAFSRIETVYLIDCSDPQRPTLKGTVRADDMEKMQLTKDTLYFFDESALSAYDVSDPSKPNACDSQEFRNIEGISIHDEAVLFGRDQENEARWIVIDISNPVSFRIRGSYSYVLLGTPLTAIEGRFYTEIEGLLGIWDMNKMPPLSAARYSR